MPTYEYRCKSCSHQFDVVQSFTDDALTTCPECGEATLKKVFGNVGITFKGSGFYKTDSRSAGSFGSAKDADRSDTGSSSSTPAKTESSTSTSGKDAGSSASSSTSTTTPSTSTASSSSTSTTPA
jgi:putative FmdB family regulatory protein